MGRKTSKGKKRPKRVVRSIVLLFFCANLMIIPVAKDTFGLGWSDVGRVVAAVATGGLSEIVIRTVETLEDLRANITDMIKTISSGIATTMNKTGADIEKAIDTIKAAFENPKRAIDQTYHQASVFLARLEGHEVSGPLASGSAGTLLPGQQGRDDQIENPSSGSSDSGTSQSQLFRPEMSRMERADYLDPAALAAQQSATAQVPPSSGSSERECPEYETISHGRKVIRIAVVPVDHETVLASLMRGEDKIKALKDHTFITLQYTLNSKISDAREERASIWDTAKALAVVALLDPLHGALATVAYYIDHPIELIEATIDPLAPVNQTIEEINNSSVQTLTELYDNITRNPMETLGEIGMAIRMAQANAELARRIYQKMADLEFCPTQRKIAALDSLVNTSSGISAQAEYVPSAGMMSSQYFLNAEAANRCVQNAVNDYLQLRRLKAEYRTKQRRIGGLDPNTKSQADRELDRLFKGKTGAEVERSKSQLMAEVRKQFAKFPNIISTTQKYIDREADLRMKGGAAPSKTAPPVRRR